MVKSMYIDVISWCFGAKPGVETKSRLTRPALLLEAEEACHNQSRSCVATRRLVTPLAQIYINGER